MRRGARRRDERGASAVEFAFVLPLLIMLLLGMTTGAFSLNSALGTTDAVREGARYGATTATSPAPSGFGSWSAAVQSKTVALSAGTLTSSAQVCVKLQKGTATTLQSSSCSFSTSEPATPSTVTSTDCIVKVWARIPVTIDIGIHRWDTHVVRSSVAHYERTCS